MKPIEVIRDLVDNNPNDQMLGEVVRQYKRAIRIQKNKEIIIFFVHSYIYTCIHL